MVSSAVQPARGTVPNCERKVAEKVFRAIFTPPEIGGKYDFRISRAWLEPKTLPEFKTIVQTRVGR